MWKIDFIETVTGERFLIPRFDMLAKNKLYHWKQYLIYYQLSKELYHVLGEGR